MRCYSKVLMQLGVLLMATQCGGVSPIAPVSPIPNTNPTEVALTTPQPLAPTAPLDKGVVIGILLTWGTDRPITDAQLYLAEVAPADQGSDLPVAVRYPDSPTTSSDSMGDFVFASLEPGSYALVLWSPLSSTLVKDGSGDSDVVFTISPGESIYLGAVFGPANW